MDYIANLCVKSEITAVIADTTTCKTSWEPILSEKKFLTKNYHTVYSQYKVQRNIILVTRCVRYAFFKVYDGYDFFKV